MNDNYKNVFKGNFGLVDEIGFQIMQFMKENENRPETVFINPFDFELLKIEVDVLMPSHAKSQDGFYYIFGLQLQKSVDINLGTFAFC